jgi:hypothetical protein
VSRQLDERSVYEDLAAVLDYAIRNLARFERRSAYWLATPESRHRTSPEKWLTEVTGLAFHVHRCQAPDPLIERARTIIEHVRVHVQHPTVYRYMIRRPCAAASGLAAAQAYLTCLGMPDEWLENRLRLAFAGRTGDFVERLPSKALRLAWLAELMGVEPPFDRASAVRLSSLFRLPDAFTCDRRDFYNLTHAVWYATDFGSRALPAGGAGPQALAEFLALAGTWALTEEDVDLMLELGLAELCVLGVLSPWSVPAVRRAQVWLAQAVSGCDDSAAGDLAFWREHHTVHFLGTFLAVYQRMQARPDGEPGRPVPAFPDAVEPGAFGLLRLRDPAELPADARERLRCAVMRGAAVAPGAVRSDRAVRAGPEQGPGSPVSDAPAQRDDGPLGSALAFSPAWQQDLTSYGLLVTACRKGSVAWLARWLASHVGRHGWTPLSLAVLRHVLGRQMPSGSFCEGTAAEPADGSSARLDDEEISTLLATLIDRG